MKKNQELLETGTYPKLLLNLCLPSVIIMLVMVVYNMADTYFIGQTGDSAKVAALSLCSPVFSILSGLGTLFGSGGCTAISLALGKKDYETVKSCSSLCFICSLVIGFAMLLVLTVGAEPIARFLGADADTLSYTVSYLRIIGFGAPLISFSNIFCNIVRADGAAVESMIANLLGTIANIVLDAVFILGLSMDIPGAALATVLGNLLSSLFLLRYLCNKQSAYSLHPKHLPNGIGKLPQILSLGMPLACSTILMSVSNVIANRMMMNYGSVALAAQGVAGKAGSMISMLLMGICMGLQPAISFNCGQGNKKRIGQILRNTAIFTVALGSLLSIGCFLLRNQLITAFLDDPDVIAYGQVMVFASILIGPFYGIYQLCQTFLQSTGKASYATITALLDKGLFYLPILLLMEHFFGMYGIAFSSAVTLFFSILAGLYFSRRWSRRL
ncbi:MAG: MATE family efflux transporter [Lachnospiraceae bacterium]|nr:MATE family efflux transporter [Lachnospiraceae bacterium]